MFKNEMNIRHFDITKSIITFNNGNFLKETEDIIEMDINDKVLKTHAIKRYQLIANKSYTISIWAIIVSAVSTLAAIASLLISALTK